MTDLTTEQKAAARPLPIFKPQLRQAIREGRKTETRRLVKQPDKVIQGEPYWNIGGFRADPFRESAYGYLENPLRCPYGKPGDIAYMREPLWTDSRIDYVKDEPNAVIYQDEPEHARDHDGDLTRVICPDSYTPTRDEARKNVEENQHWSTGKWTSMTMPRWAARTFVRITDIRVEQLHDISEQDALNDGGWKYSDCPVHKDPIRSFEQLWQSINGQDSWQANPWVWVISWEPVE